MTNYQSGLGLHKSGDLLLRNPEMIAFLSVLSVYWVDYPCGTVLGRCKGVRKRSSILRFKNGPLYKASVQVLTVASCPKCLFVSCEDE